MKLALEPEGAAMFCKYLAVDKVEHGDQSALKAFEEKAQFMVVDLGGRWMLLQLRFKGKKSMQ